MLLPLASIGATELAIVAAALGGIITAIVAIRKVGPEKEALYISSAQGAAVIMDSLVSTLRTEVDRRGVRIAELEAELAQVRMERDELRTEAEGLRRKRGERRGDGGDRGPSTS